MSFDLFQSSMHVTTLSQMAIHLTFKEIGRFASTSHLGKQFAQTMQKEKLECAFRGSSMPLEQLTGVYALKPFIQFIKQASPLLKNKITCLNLENILLNKDELSQLITLCPRIKRILMHTYTNLSPEILNLLVMLPGCKRIQVPYNCLTSLDRKYFYKLTGTTLTPNSNEELELQIQKLANCFLNLTTLTIISSTISQLPPLPDTIVKLYIHCEKLSKLSTLPLMLKHLDISGSAIKKLPLLPPSLSYLDYTDCPLKDKVNFAVRGQVSK